MYVQEFFLNIINGQDFLAIQYYGEQENKYKAAPVSRLQSGFQEMGEEFNHGKE